MMIGEPVVILLVEDNEAHAELVLESLEKHRIANDTYHVEDGEAALDFLFRRRKYADEEPSPRPHVILLDLRLPKVDGLQVLEKIKGDKSLRRIPVVVLTTSEAERDLAQAYECHANSYVVKPIDYEMFVNLMNDLGFYWLSWNKTVENGSTEGGSKHRN